VQASTVGITGVKAAGDSAGASRRRGSSRRTRWFPTLATGVRAAIAVEGCGNAWKGEVTGQGRRGGESHAGGRSGGRRGRRVGEGR
jgi:hypothetical protein